MEKFSWQKIAKPFMCLAPMEGVADTVFRRVVVKAGRPEVMFTEFISVEGLMSRGYPGMREALEFGPEEQPLIVQLWGYTPQKFFEAAKKVVVLGFAGIDINLGCPDKAVMKKGGGAALIGNKALAQKIIAATKEGASGLPVSVKTRLGIDKIETEVWIGFLLKQDLAAITIHGRTVRELSKVPAHWEEIGKAVYIRNHLAETFLSSRLGTPAPNATQKHFGCNELPVIIGNGDVVSRAEAMEKVAKYGLDGVMIGRGALKNPWIFRKLQVTSLTGRQASNKRQEKMKLLNYHLDLFEQTWGEGKPIFPLRKFFKIYVNGFPGAVGLRVRLMQAESMMDIRRELAMIDEAGV